ncbi:hypothetical protein [Gracilibacillus sp. YIM 98692]|uniref:hypothetical protein n=1 Tax=Gracilibacillus sp. YIM 98692 TaxID=2663532 RepID=UPI0013D7BA0B|nr:hypothetical protein [Gracilibacillus sp. YIM 98692]
MNALKTEFKEYLNKKFSHLKDKSVIVSDAFYLNRYDIGISLWEALNSEKSMNLCRELLVDYFTNVHKVKNPSSNSSVYMRSMKILKDFIDKTYGSVTLYIESELANYNTHASSF